MPNLFDLLDQEEDTQEQPRKLSKRAQKKALKSTTPHKIINETISESPLNFIYELEELWSIVLEYLPVHDLFLKIGALNTKELQRINTNEFIVNILKRDCKGFFNLLEDSTKYRIICGVDQSNFFRSITDELGKNLQTKQREKQSKDYKNCKPFFKSIYKQLLVLQKDLEIQEENRMHHARFFIERELGKVKLKRVISRKQLECSLSYFQERD